jgi:hypothetical protein
MPDSAYYYAEKGHRYAGVFAGLDYPIMMVALDPANADKARPIFREAIDDLRASVPPELFPIAEALEGVFEAHVQEDTAAMIQAVKDIVSMQSVGGDANLLTLGQLQVLYGQYEEGREVLSRFVTGPEQTTSGYSYPYSLYLTGVANHELGDLATAEKNFTEFLSYWGDPEIELDEIKDARRRLAELRSQT